LDAKKARDKKHGELLDKYGVSQSKLATAFMDSFGYKNQKQKHEGLICPSFFKKL
jgi:hypothetical protein